MLSFDKKKNPRPRPCHYGCLFSPQLRKISDLEKLDRHLQGFWRGLGALKASL